MKENLVNDCLKTRRVVRCCKALIMYAAVGPLSPGVGFGAVRRAAHRFPLLIEVDSLIGSRLLQTVPQPLRRPTRMTVWAGDVSGVLGGGG